MSDTQEQHPLYTDRQSASFTIRGNVSPGWFTGPAAIWTGGSVPKIIGPFDDVKAALLYQADHAQGSQIFPYYAPGTEPHSATTLDDLAAGAELRVDPRITSGAKR